MEQRSAIPNKWGVGRPSLPETGTGSLPGKGPVADRRAARAAAAIDRLEALLEQSGLPAVVLTEVGSVAWLTGGVAPPIDRSSPVDPTFVVATPGRRTLICTEVEYERLKSEYLPEQRGFDLVSVPWFDPSAYVRAAEQVSGVDAGRIGADGHPVFGEDCTAALVAARLALSAPEREDLLDLGSLAARALSEAARSWHPGLSRDLDVQAVLVATLEEAGADAPVVIVGGDERVERFRHPLAIGERVERLLMVVVVARRAGLHVAATRFAVAGNPSRALIDRRRTLAGIDDAVLSACRPGTSYAEVVAELARAYAEAGEPGAWREHYQGGPIGFRQREFEPAPGDHDGLAALRVAEQQAVAWNPSLSGGAKYEDTYLVGEEGLDLVTADGSWPAEEPAEEPGVGRRPAILEAA